MLTANWVSEGTSAYITGEGPTIVLLHSLLADRGSLEAMIPFLEREFRLVLLDLPGFGQTARSRGTIEDYADRVAEGVHQTCGKERPLLFGNGFGSFIGLAVALSYPDSIRSLCLAGCGATFSEEGRAAFRFMAGKVRESGLESIVQVAMRRLFPPQQMLDLAEAVEERRLSFLNTDVEVFCDACEILAALDLRDAAGDLAVPLLASAGSLDEATPPEMARELAALVPEGEFRLIPDNAHVPPVTAPDIVSALLRQCFNRTRVSL